MIPPRQQIQASARSTLSSLTTSVGMEMVGRDILAPEHRNQTVNVVNTTETPMVLRSGTWLGNIQPVQVMTNVEAPVEPQRLGEEARHAVLDNLPEYLSEDQRRQVVGMLDRFGDVFSENKFDMGRIHLVEHTIDTGEHRPIHQGLRRHPRAHLDITDNQVSDLLKNDFIELAASPWASNVVLVRKKDGSHRLCVDYRAVNSVTYKDTYPLPHIDTCLESMDGSEWFTTLDLRSGYHNIPIKEADRDKTAFITRRGSFRYKVMPFGLSTAPSVFQRLMDLVLCRLTYETCLVYLDNIIVYSKDFGGHVRRLEEVLKRLRQANLKLQPTKSSFFRRSVSFLGHVILEDGIGVQEGKYWPPPKNLTELRGFIGLCSYYRRFISGFSEIAAPMYKLMKKDVPFV